MSNLSVTPIRPAITIVFAEMFTLAMPTRESLGRVR